MENNFQTGKPLPYGAEGGASNNSQDNQPEAFTCASDPFTVTPSIVESRSSNNYSGALHRSYLTVSLHPSSVESVLPSTSMPYLIPGEHRRSCQSRPSSPPPMTYLPPRRPSLSLPPSPHNGRIQRVSLPLLPSDFGAASGIEGGSYSASSPSVSRHASRSPASSPSPFGRSSRRRSARTPSPRPPLPLPASPNEGQPQIRSRSASQPHKIKMRSR